ncbi:Uncharacterised protein [Shigella sonnei]|nr:Uncharacterised protein [Shigella sonnei]CSG07913.1 Uncharacterised protein [Shigella sonnei]CSG20603.1 Uncharacterised protein [Shigella sonnei]CSG44719.1 Uncharacterised protein [Shigella sonnei]CSI27832.1 Uncharacterised protein [Shigella sonnei]
MHEKNQHQTFQPGPRDALPKVGGYSKPPIPNGKRMAALPYKLTQSDIQRPPPEIEQ